MNSEEALNKIADSLERIAENYPERESIRFFAADTDTVTAGTSLTVTFLINWRRFRVKVSELYADARADCDYEWWFAGSYYAFNEATFDFGKKAIEDAYHEIKLVITNTGEVDQEIGYYVKGWAVAKGA
ncbi:hypothetical protein ES705_10353 [subsurface metagenome]